MGEPRRLRKKYETPFKPWDRELLMQELVLIGEYGLRNKRELRRAEALLRKMRAVARSLYGLPIEERMEEEKKLISKLYRLGILPEKATLDDVLKLTVRDILERRLQTIVYRKGLAKTIYQSRQMIVHRHVMVGDRIVDRPSYLVSRDEEDKISFSPRSPYSNPNHSIWGGVKSGE